MSNWKVFKSEIEVFPHPNAEKLEICKVGSYQLVTMSNLYKTGDIVVFCPEKSLVSGIIQKEFEKYLVGSEKNRVKSVRLRGIDSCGIIIGNELLNNLPDISQYAIGEDISEIFGITKYEAPIPQSLSGKITQVSIDKFIGKHDCEQYAAYQSSFINGERVIVSEKIHGSQFIWAYEFETDKVLISSKGQLAKGFEILEEEGNTYWRAAKNDNLLEKVKKHFTEGVIQIFGEVVPVQGGYTYGFDPNQPTVLIFDIRQNGVSIPYDQVSKDFKWVNILYDGVLTMDVEEKVLFEGNETTPKVTKNFYHFPKWLIDLGNAKENNGMERYSGKSLHISEGVVVRPHVDRYAADGTKLRVKIISDKYAKTETGDEIN